MCLFRRHFALPQQSIKGPRGTNIAQKVLGAQNYPEQLAFFFDLVALPYKREERGVWS